MPLRQKYKNEYKITNRFIIITLVGWHVLHRIAFIY
jgi:hypothetical protein